MNKHLLSLTITGLFLVLIFACNKNDTRPDVNSVIRIEAAVPQTFYLIRTNRVVLDATYTSTLNAGKSLFFYWNCPTFPSGALPLIHSPEATVTGVDRLTAGKYVFTLSVGDNLGNVSFREFKMLVLPDTLINSIAKSVVGPNQTIRLPRDWVLLEGNGSFDVNPKGRELQFLWEVISKPAGNRAIDMGDTRQHSALARGFEAGNYLFRLTVTNEFESKGLDTVEINVLPDTLKGTTRIYDNVEWKLGADDEGFQINQVEIVEPGIFDYRSPINTEILIWNNTTQQWEKPKYENFYWIGSTLGLSLFVPLSVDDLTGEKIKVRARFF